MAEKSGRPRENPDHLLLVRVGYDEIDLRRAVRAVRGAWDPSRRGWELRGCLAVHLGLEERVIGTVEEASEFG